MIGRNYIWLDDIREKPEFYDIWCRDYGSFVECVKSFGGAIINNYISFDHDLGEGKNGYDCAKFLVDWCLENGYGLPDYNIHSANPVGRENIRSIFESYWKVHGK